MPKVTPLRKAELDLLVPDKLQALSMIERFSPIIGQSGWGRRPGSSFPTAQEPRCTVLMARTNRTLHLHAWAAGQEGPLLPFHRWGETGVFTSLAICS